MTCFEQLNEARRRLSEFCSDFPPIVLVLGSGLASVLDSFRVEKEIAFSDIPFVKQSTVEGHDGKMLVGRFGGTRIACLKGRLHYYEGYAMESVVFPFRLMAWMGGKIFVLTNSSGGLHSEMSPSKLVLVSDHINLMGTNPLIGENLAELGPRFPDISRLYDPALNRIFLDAAKAIMVPLRQGVYVAIHGPSYETPSEIKMFRLMGGDVVGMSTVPEAIALHHMGCRVVALSCVTNLAAGVGVEPLVHSDVIRIASKMSDSLQRLFIEVLPKLETPL